MIIKSIHIDGFGALRDKEYTFNEGLNIISGENETGKTTVAEFIRAMLYGFEGRARSVRDNERRRYMPADGGAMGGRMEIENDGKIYIIERKFGKTAAGDKLTVSDGITGKEINILPEELICLDGESFSKTLYIKQMCTKIEDSKDDEIRQRLINLCQTGDEDLSYQAAMKRLDDAYKQLTSKAKGIIPALNGKLSDLLAERAVSAGDESRRQALEDSLAAAVSKRESSINQSREESREGEYYAKYDEWRKAREQEAQEKKAEHDEVYNRVKKELGASVRWSIINAVLCLVCVGWLVYHMTKSYSLAAPMLVAVIFGAMCIKNITEQQKMRKYLTENEQYTCNNYENDVKYSKWFCSELGSDEFERIPQLIKDYGDKLRIAERTKSDEAIAAVERVKDIESSIAAIDSRPVVAVNQDITMCENKIRTYEDKAAVVLKARSALEEAFRLTEQNFAPLITREASPVLCRVTDGAYEKLLSDNIYVLSAVKSDGGIVSADYLSTGAYDQIYFALRIGIIKLMAQDKPIIFDDAFAYYDDKRLKNTMAVLKELPNQILLFSCHGREQNF